MQTIYYCDGFYGFLTACSKLIEKSYSQVEFKASNNKANQLGLFDNGDDSSPVVKADEKLVRQFSEKIIEKIGEKFFAILDNAFRHTLPEKETYCYHALRLGFQYGSKVLQFRQDIKIARFLKMAQAVGFEIHRFYGFTRFKEHKESNFMLAKISPRFDILEPLAHYFRMRLNTISWLIATDTHVALWDQKQLNFGKLSNPIHFDDEDSIEQLWQQYYQATTNLQRWNWRTFQNFLPIYYQKHMPEKKVIQAFSEAKYSNS